MKYSTWDENLAARRMCRPRRGCKMAIIREELPDVAARYDPGNGLLAFGQSMQMRDLLFALIPHAGWVNLQLADGADLPDPDGLIEGTGKKIRHIKVRSTDAALDPVRDSGADRPLVPIRQERTST